MVLQLAGDLLKDLDQSLKPLIEGIIAQLHKQVRSIKTKVKTILTQLERSVEHFMREEVIQEEMIDRIDEIN